MALKCALSHQQTIRIHDNAPSFLHDEGSGGDVPAVHPNVVVDVGRARGHLTHAHRRRPQRSHPGTDKQQPSRPRPQAQSAGRSLRTRSPLHGKFEKCEDVGGHGGQSEVVTLRPDLRHQHTLAHVCGGEGSVSRQAAQEVMSQVAA